MKRLLFLLFLLLSVCEVFAQKKGRDLIDSLFIELPYVDDTQKVRVYSTLCRTFASINPDSSILLGEKGMALAKSIGWKKGITLVASGIGLSYQNRSDHATALKYYLEALQINQELKDMRSVAMSLGNIGNVYYGQKSYDKALKYYKEGLRINDSLGAKDKMATVLGNIANVYMYQYDTAAKGSKHREVIKQKTLGYFEQAIKLYEEVGDKNGIARNKGNEGNLYKDEDDRTMSLRLYKESLELSKETGNKLMQLAMQINIAMLYNEVAQDKTGKLRIENYTSRDRSVLVNKGLAMATELVKEGRAIGYNELLYEGLATLSSLYAMSGNYKMAYEAQAEYAALKDTLHKLNSEETVAKLEAKNKLDQQEKEIEIQKLAVAKKRNTNWFMGIGIIVLLFVIGFVIKERKKSETVLLNILPKKIAERLKAKEHPIADQFAGASIMFIDIAGFTHIASEHEPKELVSMLNDIFTMFDRLAERHGLEKIKTIGDSYMAVAGVPLAMRDHALAAANMALEVKELVKGYKTKGGIELNFRIGLDCGPVVAGVIGTKKFSYDLWGDAVNMASRMESTGLTGEIHCSSQFKNEILGHRAYAGYHFTERGSIEIKGKGRMQTWLLSKAVKEPELV